MATIAALCPPGSTTRLLYGLRRSLFERWGAVSALALPPLICLSPWPGAHTPARTSALLARCARAGSLPLGALERHGGSLYLAVPSPVLEEMGQCLRAAAAEAGELSGEAPLLRPHAGVWLAGPDLAAEPSEIEAAVGPLAERSFRSFTLSVWRIETRAPAERWWDHAAWVEEARVPVKSSGRAAPGSAARL